MRPIKLGRAAENFFSLFSGFGLGEEKEYFIENLSLLIASGMNVGAGLESLAVEVRSFRMKRAVEGISSDIGAGEPLWRALDKSRIFNHSIISLIKIGEESGRLTENLRLISRQQQKERVFRSRVRSAMMYPIIVLFLTVVVGAGIAWFILPRLSIVFGELDIPLPWITRGLIFSGAFLGKYGSVVMPIFLLALATLIYVVFFRKKSKHLGQALLIRFPGVKRLIREVEIARLGYLLGTLLQAGLPVLAALDSLADSTVFRVYQDIYSKLREAVEEGRSIKKSFLLYPEVNILLPLPIQQMIVAAEQSGHLADTLKTIGDIYEEKTETTTKNISVLLEPLLLVIVWLGVVAVALAVILPIYSLIGGLNR